MEDYEPYGKIKRYPKGNYKKYNIWAFDTENENDGTVTIINFYNGVNHYTFLPQEQGFDIIYTWMYSKANSHSIFVAHNLEYDITNLFREKEFCFIDEMMYAGSRLITCKLKKSHCKFIDSWNFFSGKLSAMGEMLGYEKGDYAEARLSVEENIKYCRQDCKILWEFMDKFQDKVNEEDGLSIPSTIGRIALDSFRRNHLKQDYVTYNGPECLKAYAGGRVECFRVGDIKGNIYFQDINSSYPTQMLREYPDCDTLKEGVDPLNTLYGIAEVSIYLDPEKFPVGPLKYVHNKKLTFPVGYLKGYWTFLEIQKAVHLGAELIKVHSSIGTNHGINDLFHSFVMTNYKKRKTSPNPFDNTYFKLKLNNGYGKFAQHNDSTALLTREMDLDEREKRHAKLVDINGPFYFYTEKMVKPPKFACYMWGAYITAYARDYLLDGMLKIHNAGHELIYCDTDSILYRCKDDDTKPVLPIGKNLGEWDNEIFSKAEVHSLKAYVLTPPEGSKDKNGNPRKIKIASKGVPTEHALEYFKGKEIQYRKPNKLKESFKRDILPNLWEVNTKQNRSNYDKRIVLQDGSTNPIFIEKGTFFGK